MTELEIIARQGFKWMNGDQEIASTVDLLMVSVDIPHNGSKCCACNGCSWLPPPPWVFLVWHKGKTKYKKMKGHDQVSPFEQTMKKKLKKERIGMQLSTSKQTPLMVTFFVGHHLQKIMNLMLWKEVLTMQCKLSI